MITLCQLRLFEAVARLRGYTRTANELGVTQLAVSIQVSEPAPRPQPSARGNRKNPARISGGVMTADTGRLCLAIMSKKPFPRFGNAVSVSGAPGQSP